MTVLITLTTAGADTGPFDLYSNLDGFTTPFETGVAKASLLSGYSSVLVPDYAITIRVKSEGDCINYVDISLEDTTTTTTSTSTTSTSTTSTTSTTTTTLPTTAYCYVGLYSEPDPLHPFGGTVTYLDAYGNSTSVTGIWDVDYVEIIASSIVSAIGVTPISCTTTTSLP